MLENYPEELRTLILLKLTKNLVIGTNPTPFLKANRERELKRIKKLEKEAEKINKEIDATKQSIPPQKIFIQAPQQNISKKPSLDKTKSPLKIPGTNLPQKYSHVNPSSSNEIILDLGRMAPLIRDPAVKIIEVHGPGQPALVKGIMGTQPTDITLGEKEIESIINSFSDKSGINIKEDTTKITLGRLSLTIITSQHAPTKFQIKKII